ncbi:MAG: dTDP-4-dehydrorhamnose 3,5-epimerase [candidate division WWE3 bacterium GW2011_GWA1_42_12]|uniref:dTDP-4-dehydrorhamnose 3,5-epimerase n=1 Tax=Candidatus Woesebacteria bacterium GW2011_GWB1_40_12 TaxID=1618576 RepID=A0A0G0QMD5_9BACT|nr:MAG: dTDP-4-dehydrorhamnose 3,5-epimerase [Candidatus Woesebacteria bacterium GW2011_GWB1_40_12]KKS30471.1 MAG: dTDP-4-dehydrorhamnose 3,5-epimerase [candidate division WWE3 bacterium GW2011_GWA1_42_12]
MPFTIQANEPMLIISKVFEDDRGYFFETYKKTDFEKIGIKEDFVQDNLSYSVQGVLRGLHYQMDPAAQGKLVMCLKGKVLDVTVDIRKGSPSYGKWRADVLTEKSGHMLYVPPGFAHGFLTLSKSAIFLYKCTKEYNPDADRGIIWNDPEIGVDWQIKKPILSLKDQKHPTLKDADNNFIY